MELKVKERSKLLEEIYWFLREKYIEGNPVHYILLVGIDSEMAANIAQLISHFLYRGEALLHASCNKLIDESAKEFATAFFYFRHLCSVFLLEDVDKMEKTRLHSFLLVIENLVYRREKFNQLTKEQIVQLFQEAAECRIVYPKEKKLVKIVPGNYGYGTLIINTNNPNLFPEYIRKHFEIIKLEPQTTPGIKDTPRQIKLLRGKKGYYAKPDEFNSFLLNIIKQYKNITLDKKANMAISQMEGRKLFLNDKGKPKYKKSTIKKMLSKQSKLSKPKKNKR